MRAGILVYVLLAACVHVTCAAADASFPLSLTNGSRLMLDAKINGHPVTALLDSAAEATMIDGEFAKSIQLGAGIAAVGHGSGQSAFDASLIKGVTLQALNLTLPDQTIAVVDLSDVGRRLLGGKLDAILGREIFDAARLRIDIDGRRISVVKDGGIPPGIKLDLVEEHGVETIPVTVEGTSPLRATFDLGNGSEVLIGLKLAGRMHLLTDGREVRIKAGGGLGGETSRQVITLRTVEIAGHNFASVDAAVDTQPTASDVNVGINLLRQFVITTDFAKHSVWLEPRH